MIADSRPAVTVGSGVDAYYRLHARIYDATRWTFLHGRSTLVEKLRAYCQPQRVLEIGCGTGHNLALLGRAFPSAKLTGVDLSTDMLAIAEKKLRVLSDRLSLRQQRYESPLNEGFDLVICSYALSMFNPGWDDAIRNAREELRCGGHFALVDFHHSPVPAFRKWMAMNHVRMEAHLLPELKRHFTPDLSLVRSTAAGLWSHLLFIGHADGEKKEAP